MMREPERVADGVWIVRGGFPRRIFNVYLIESTGGVVVFDAGVKQMTKDIARAAARFGGIERVVLGHAHSDHRGAAPGLNAPVFCHATEKPHAESENGEVYFRYGELDLHGRLALRRLMGTWDGGPVAIAGTLEEGDEVAGFRVVHIPGHSPGQIALFRDRDRLALVSDAFYTLDPQTGLNKEPRLPHPALSLDHDQARESLRKLAALEPRAAWPGHARPVDEDVAATLNEVAGA